VILLLALAFTAAGCSSHPNAAAIPAVTSQDRQAQAGRPDPRRFLSSSPSAKTVHLTMLAALGSSNNGFNFDGYGRGELIASVPRGWRVTVQFQNRGPRRASAAVVTGARSATLAFPGAAVPDPIQGIAPGGTSQFSFTAGHTGVFRIASLVPGQAEARMYAVLVVTGGGRPSITARPGP
jgi:sulfocyanin SoxE-like protein